MTIFEIIFGCLLVYLAYRLFRYIRGRFMKSAAYRLLLFIWGILKRVISLFQHRNPPVRHYKNGRVRKQNNSAVQRRRLPVRNSRDVPTRDYYYSAGYDDTQEFIYEHENDPLESGYNWYSYESSRNNRS
jgi:hypothetical protein